MASDPLTDTKRENAAFMNALQSDPSRTETPCQFCGDRQGHSPHCPLTEVARLQQENARLRIFCAPHRWQSYPLADTGDWSTLCSGCGAEDDGQNSGDDCPALSFEKANAAREAAEAVIAGLRHALEDLYFGSAPQAPGGQHVGPSKYSMTPSTRKALKWIIDNHVPAVTGDAKETP